MEQKNSAVILRVRDFGEADRLVTFFTEDFGKMRGIAKHAKRSRRRFSGGLEEGSIGLVRYEEKTNKELVRLEDFIIEYPIWKISEFLEGISALHIALEIADKMLPLGQASQRRFKLLKRWIIFLHGNPLLPSHLHAFYYKWLALSGLEPLFDRCVACGNSLLEGYPRYVNSSHGGAVCKKCRGISREGIEISNSILKYLAEFKSGKISNGVYKDADKVFEYLLIHATGAKLRSLEVARKIGR